MIVAELLEFPGQEQILRWLPADELPTPAAQVARVMSALAALDGVVRPLSAELGAACGEAGDDPLPQHFFHVQQAELPPGVAVAPASTPVDCQCLPRLTPAALQRWIEAALAGLPCAAGLQPLWLTLGLDGSLARLCEAPAAAAALDTGDGAPLPLPLLHEGDATWLAGPLPELPDRAPVTLEFSHTAGALRLVVAAHWSPWAGDSPGALRLRQALDGLLAQGWQREPSP